jgi:hypothetical protein
MELHEGVSFPPPESGVELVLGTLACLAAAGEGVVAKASFPLPLETRTVGHDEEREIELAGAAELGWEFPEAQSDILDRCPLVPAWSADIAWPMGCGPEDIIALNPLKDERDSSQDIESSSQPSIWFSIQKREVPMQCMPLAGKRIPLRVVLSGCSGWLETSGVKVWVSVDSETVFWPYVLLAIVLLAAGLAVLLWPPSRVGLFVQVGSAKETVFRNSSQKRRRVLVAHLVPGLDGEIVFEVGERSKILIAAAHGARLTSQGRELVEPIPVLQLQKAKPGLRKLLSVQLENGDELSFGKRKS